MPLGALLGPFGHSPDALGPSWSGTAKTQYVYIDFPARFEASWEALGISWRFLECLGGFKSLFFL